MVTTSELFTYEHGATEEELGAYEAARAAAEVSEPHPRRYRDLFLISVRQHPRQVPAVAIVGINADGSRVLDAVWVYLPARRGAFLVDRGEAFDRTAEALRFDQLAMAEFA